MMINIQILSMSIDIDSVFVEIERVLSVFDKYPKHIRVDRTPKSINVDNIQNLLVLI